MSPGADRRQINLSIPPKVHERLAAMANNAGMSTTAYAGMLLMAAYSARCAETGDRALDTSVARVVVLWGTRAFDTDEIGRFVGIRESTVVDIIDTWRAEVLGEPSRRAAA